MQRVEKQIRAACLCLTIGMGLLLYPLSGRQAAWAASSRIETMSMDELNRLMGGGQGMYLMFFTASWCGHCKTMLPTLNRLYQHFHQSGLHFVAISIDAGGPQAMQRVLSDHRVDFPVYWVGESAVDALRLIGIPMIFLIKKDHRVEKIPGTCSYTFLEAKIQDLIK